MATSAIGERFDIGRVISKTFSAIFANPVPLIGFALAIALVSAVLNSLTMMTILGGMNTADPQAALGMFTSPSYWIALIGGVLVGAFGQAGLIHGFVAGRNGALPSLGDCFAGAVGSFIPLIGLTILWYLGIMLGMMLLIVPGVILIVMWSVSVPVLVAENGGVIDAFGRSRALTKGLRWPIFGVLLIMAIVIGFISFAVQGFSSIGLVTMYQSSPVLAVIVMTLSGIVTTLLLTSFLSALYDEVVLVKEGGASGGLAEIFS